MEARDLTELYKDAAFAHRLAAALVGESASEDVWQEAWRSILERPPRAGWNVSAHLRNVVHGMALHHRRAERRRRDREVSAARTERLPSSEELVSRTEVHRTIVQAVLELEEPYRRTLLLIYFESHDAADIARRDGIPLETVRTHKKRALARLRSRLEREHGADREWLQSLVAIAGLRGRPASSLALPSSATVALGVAATLVVSGVLVWLVVGGGSEARQGSSPAVASVPSSGTILVPEFRALREPLPLESVAPVDAGAATEPEPTLLLAGRFHGESGDGIPDVDVTIRIAGLHSVATIGQGRSDADGHFSVRVPALPPQEVRSRTLEFVALAHGFQPSLTQVPLIEVGPSFEQDILLAPGRTLAGRVVDEHGHAAVNAFVVAYGVSDGGETRMRITEADQNGDYLLGLKEDTRLTGIDAWDPAIGSGFVPESELPALLGPLARAADIVLRERAVLRVQASYPDGSPAREVALTIFRVVEDERGRWVAAPATPASTGGVWSCNGTTDDAGRCAFYGLAEGPYLFGMRTSPPRSDPEHGYAKKYVAWAGREEAQLLVGRRRVVVEVRDSSGAPLPDLAVLRTQVERDSTGSWRQIAEPTRSITGLSGRAGFASKEADTLALTVLFPGWACERLVTIPGDQWETLERFELTEPTPRGGVRLLASDDTPLAGARLRLLTDPGGIPVDGTWRSDAAGLVRDLPVGSFRAEVAGGESAADPWQRPGWAAVEIRAGGTVDVKATHERGARLTVLFEAEPLPPVTAAPSAPNPNMPLSRALVFYPKWRAARLWRAEDPPEAPPFLALANARPGERWTSEEPIPPGRYRLEVSFDGYEPTREWIDAEAGRTSEVVVRLVPRRGER